MPLDAIEGVSPTVEGGAIRLRRAADVVEWWRALPSGLEHGMTLARRPDGRGELDLRVRFEGPYAARIAGDDVELVDADGRVAGGYRALLALDSRGREVPARFVGADESSVSIRIDDANAEYPLVVDPLAWSQQSVLSPSVANSSFGVRVAISADGTRAIVSARDDGSGAAYIFVRSGNAWAQEQRLVAATTTNFFGSSVAMDGLGTRVVIGANAETGGGAAYVFSRSGTTWTQEQRIVSSDRASVDLFGAAVGMSEDGSRVVVTAAGDGDASIGLSQGSAYVFSRSGTVWSQEQKVQALDRAQYDQLGVSVSMSSDGSRFVVGAYDEWEPTATYFYSGMVYVFVRSGTTWSQETKLRASDQQTNAYFGASVGISLDGTRLIGGAREQSESTGTATTTNGAAYVFVRSGSTWSFERKLLASDRATADQYGGAVAIDRTGARVLVGAHFDDEPSGTATTTNGAVYAYVRSGTTWTEEQKLFTNPRVGAAEAGIGVSLDGAGDTALVGSISKAYVFDLLKTNGTGCSGNLECGSGYCVDGVCCNAPCGGNTANDCQACSGALTGGADGTCAALSVFIATTVVCRGSVTTCDAAEVCQPASTTCPPDGVATASVECRPASDLCDAPEMCDGVSNVCPAQALRGNGYACRPSVGPCDVAETCDGVSAACPANVVVGAGVTCRPANGGCDVAETCDGVVGGCPGDAFVATGTVCRPAASVCDLAEACSGGAPACPGDIFATAGTVCRAQDGACDFTEVCDNAGNCPADAVRPPTFRCGISGSPCDLDDYCDGATKMCPNDTVTDGTVCDDSDTCSQTSNCQQGACIAQITLDCSDGNPCTTDACANPTGCTHTLIASCGDAAVPVDASSAQDSGTTTPPAPQVGGCSCSVARATDAAPLAWLGSAAVAVLVIARRRRIGSRS